MKNIQALADSFVNTDTAAIRDDVTRGGVEAVAEYCASMAIGQPDWEPLASDEGRAALCRTIREILVTFAELKGQMPFNWNGFLARATEGNISDFELAEAKDLCGHWVSCACGNQCASLPRWPDGRPIDDIARALGNEFAIHVDSGSWRLAKITLGQIEARSRELLSKVSSN